MTPTVTTTAYNADNQLTQWGTATLTYDANGNMLSNGTDGYTWDARNRLVSTLSGATTPEQDQAIQDFITKNRTGPYNTFGRSCVKFVEDALNAGHVPFTPTNWPHNPKQLMQNLMNQYPGSCR